MFAYKEPVSSLKENVMLGHQYTKGIGLVPHPFSLVSPSPENQAPQ